MSATPYTLSGSLTLQEKTTFGAGTTGNQTANTMTGNIRIAAGNTSVTVTNSLVSSTSVIMCTLATADANATTLKSCAPGSGSFIITLQTAPAAEVNINWVVFN